MKVPIPKPSPTSPAWPQLKTSVAFEDGAGGALVVGKHLSDTWGFTLEGATQILALPFDEPLDCWTSANGASYLATKGRFPLVLHHGGKFSYLPMDVPSGEIKQGVCFLQGIAGPTPEDDALTCLGATERHGFPGETALYLRREGAWREEALPLGGPRALSLGPAGEVYVGLSRLWQPDRPGALLRWTPAGLERLAFPAAEDVGANGPCGLMALPDGRLLALFSDDTQEGPARPWLRAPDGVWTRLDEPCRFHGWLGVIRCRAWRGETHLPTQQGVLVLDAQGRLRRESEFQAISLWPVGEALVCRGWQSGAAAHQVHRGRGWEPFHVSDPGVVPGGQGKAVFLGAGNKLPVRKPRMPAPKREEPTRAGTPAQPPSPQGTFSLAGFLTALAGQKGATRRETPQDAVQELEALYGAPLATDLRAFFELTSSHQLDGGVGLWNLWPETYFPRPTAEGTLEELAARVYTHVPTLVAALTQTVPLGADGGGQVYFAQVDGQGSEVFLFGPGVGELKLLADSFTSFAHLNALEDEWQALREDEGLDEEAVTEGTPPPSSPRLLAIRAGLRGLKGKLNLSGFEKSDVSSDFDEIMPVLAGVKLRASPGSIVPKLWKNTGWLAWLLAHGQVHLEEARRRDFKKEMKDPARADLAATKIYWLWHLYLFARDQEIESLLARVREDPSGLVRGTARLITTLKDGRELAPAFEQLRARRALVLGELSDPGASQRALAQAQARKVEAPPRGPDDASLHALLRPDRADTEAIRTQKRVARSHPRMGPAWDTLLFAYWQAKRWDDMLAAAEARLSLDDDAHYPWLQRGIALQMLGRVDEALEAMGHALTHKRSDADTWVNMSFLYAKRRDWPRAFTHLREAVQYNPAYKALARDDEDFAPVRQNPEFLAIVN